MPESSDESALVRRANRVGMRTLRQRPTVVDHTARGAPVFEIRSVRLILREDGTHFNRLLQCSRCEGEVAGSAVRTPADLNRPAASVHTVVCKECVQAAAMPAQQPRSQSAPEAEPVAEASPALVPADATDEDRLATVEADMLAAASRLTQLSAAVEAEAALRSRTEEEIAARLGPLIHAVQDIRAKGAAEAEAIAARLVALEEQGSEARAADGPGGRPGESVGLADALTAEILRVDEEHRQTAQSQAELERRLHDLAQSIVSLPAAFEEALRRVAEAFDRTTQDGKQRLEALEMRVADAVEPPTARIDAIQGGVEEVRRSQDELRQGLEAVVRQLEPTAGTANVDGDLRRMEEQLSRLAELFALTTQADNERLEALATRVAGVDDLATASAARAQQVRLDNRELRRNVEGALQQLQLSRDDGERRALVRIEELTQRLVSLSDTFARAAEKDELRLQSLVRGVAAALEAPTAHVNALHAEVDQVRTGQEQLGQRLQAVEAQVVAALDGPTVRIDGLQAGLDELRAALAAEAERLSRRSQEQVSDGLQGVVQQVEATAGATSDRARAELARLENELGRSLLAVDTQVAAAVEGSTARIDALQAGIEEMRTALAAEGERVSRDSEYVRRTQDELSRGLEELAQQHRLAAEVEAARVTERLRAVDEHIAATVERSDSRIDALTEGIDELRTALAGEAGRLRLDSSDVRQSQEELSRRLEEVAQQLNVEAARAGGELRRLEAQVHQNLEQVAQSGDARLQAVEGQLVEGRLFVEKMVDELRSALSAQAHELAGIAEQLQQRAAEGSAARERTDGELASIKEQLNERLEGLEQRVTDAARSDTARMRAMERRIGEAVDGRLARTEAHQAEDRAQLAELAVRAEVAEASVARVREEANRNHQSNVERMQRFQRSLDAEASRAATDLARLEQANAGQIRNDEELHERIDRLAESQGRRLEGTERDQDIEDLFEFHAALDAGMGQLRSELAQIRATTSALADTLGDIQDRLDDRTDASRPAGASRPSRARRAVRKLET